MSETYIVMKNGRPQVVHAFDYQGFLLHPTTALPVIDEQKLAVHPRRDSILETLNTFPSLDIDKASKPIDALTHSEQKKKFYALSQAMRNPALRDVTVAAPKPGLLAYKIYAGDYNFTPTETEALSKLYKPLLQQRQIPLLAPVLELSPPPTGAHRSFAFIKECLALGAHDTAALVYSLERSIKPGLSYLGDIFTIAMKAKSRPLAEAILADMKALLPEMPELQKLYNTSKSQMRLLPDTQSHTSVQAKKYINFISFAQVFENAQFEITNRLYELFEGHTTEAKDAQIADFLYKRINRLNYQRSPQPIHDALLKAQLPTRHELQNKAIWMKKIMDQMSKPFGPQNPDLVAMLQHASRIERAAEELGISFSRLTPLRIEAIASQLSYENAGDDPELASLCREFHISQYGFNLGVKARKNIATEDNIPDIGIIEGKDLGFPDLYMMKVPKSDPRILLMGSFVNCCNHLDGATASMALAHVTSPYGGCYALFRKNEDGSDKLISKTSVWLSKTKRNGHSDLVFNSWEGRQALWKEGPAFLTEAANRAMAGDPLIERVLLGRNRYNYAQFPKVPQPAVARDPATASYDSTIQFLIR